MEDRQLYLFGLKTNPGETSKKQRVGLPLDILIIVGVVFSLSLIVAFSLGVEKGKKIALRKLNPDTVVAEQSSEEVKIDFEKKPEVTSPKLPVKASDTPVETVSDKQKYNIQVASFQQETAARREVEQLKEKGYPTSTSKKGKYIVIYVGEFDDKEKAKSNLEHLKKRYKDCFLRQL
ncbi:MAG: SPOR domain-containing protein [Candidatus Omnitrophica bacterium]|nr:SPOR domain-containing protein [Candidatus Omnitrophota bacterium]MBU2250909.1 SPOR domain-containing protein [Candidatus Omnitrophota bacterium]